MKRLRYALTPFGAAGAALLLSAYLLKVWTDLEIAPWVIALVFLLDGVMEVIIDPLVGWFSDHFKTRFGRRRHLIWIGGLLLPLSMAGGFAGWIWCVFLFNIAQALIDTPWRALPRGMTNDPDERQALVTAGAAGFKVAELVSIVAVGILAKQFGWVWASVMAGVVYSGFAFLAPKEVIINDPPKRSPFLPVLKNKKFRRFLKFAFPGAVLLGVIVPTIPFLASDATIVLAIAIILIASLAPVVQFFIRHFGFEKVLIVSAIQSAVTLSFSWLLMGSLVGDIIYAVIISIGVAGYYVGAQSYLVSIQEDGAEAEYAGLWRMMNRAVDNVSVAILSFFV